MLCLRQLRLPLTPRLLGIILGQAKKDYRNSRLAAQISSDRDPVEAGIRLSVLYCKIPVLFQVEFLPRPRTQHSPDLVAVDRALVRGCHGASWQSETRSSQHCLTLGPVESCGLVQ